MRSKRLKVMILALLTIASSSSDAFAGRGGFRGGGGGGGGYRGGGGGGFRGGYAGRSSGGYSGGRSYGGGYGNAFAGRSMSTGGYGGSYASGARSGSYTTNRGGTVNYGAAGRAGVGPGGAMAGRGAYGVEGTTAGGRSFADAGRAGGVSGPGGISAGSRSNVGVASGRYGEVAGGSRSAFTTNRGHGGYGASGYGAVGAHGYGYGSGGVGAWGGHNRAYAGYNAGWVHGYWGGGYGGYGGWGYGGYGALGAGLGFGLASWGLGSALYSGGWGYMPYANPYYSQPIGLAAAQPFYDDSQPIDTSAAAPPETVVQPAMTTFDQARSAFKLGDYAQALALTDQAIQATPNNPDLHEFRALSLIALKRFDEAASALFGVLSVGPGWDWTTLIGFYPDIDVFTSQLRDLEAFCKLNPRAAAPAFDLAYLYLSEGQNDAAIIELKQVTALQPGDRLSAQLLQSLTGTAPAAPAATASIAPASVSGNWTASPTPGTTIGLSIGGDGKFSWTVTDKAQSHQLAGQSTYGDGVLTLVQTGGNAPMVGRVSASGADSFLFHALGGGPGDPGLTFHRAR